MTLLWRFLEKRNMMKHGKIVDQNKVDKIEQQRFSQAIKEK